MGTFRLFRWANLAFLVGFLPASTAIAGEDSSSSAKVNAQTPSAQLQDALIDHDWVAVNDSDGSVRYLPPVPRIVAGASSPVPALAAGLSDALTRQGWVVETDREGNQIYRKPARVAVASNPAPAGPGTLTDQLRGELESQGWRAMKAGNGGDVYYLPPTPGEASPPTIAYRLSADLEQQGWVRYAARDGSVIYRAPVPVPAPSVTAAPAAESPALSDLLRQQLQRRGWQVRPAEDGSTILARPPGRDLQGFSGEPGASFESAPTGVPGADDSRDAPVSATAAVPAQPETVDAGLPHDAGGPVSSRDDSNVVPYPTWGPPPGRHCGRMAPPVRRGSPYWGPAPAWQQPVWVWPQHRPYPYR